MKAKKALGAGLVGLSLPMLVAGLSMVGPALGADSTDTTAAAIQSTVTTEDQCEWRVANAPGGLTLTAAGEYELNDLDLTASVTGLTVYSTGNTHDGDETGYTDCVFYGDVLEPTLTMEIDGTAVDGYLTASGSAGDADTSMDFSIDGTNPMTIVTADTCTDWTVASPSLSTTTAATVMSIVTAVIDDNIESAAGGNQTCALDQTITLTVPGGKVPSSPGAGYTFAGPSLTTELTQAVPIP